MDSRWEDTRRENRRDELSVLRKNCYGKTDIECFSVLRDWTKEQLKLGAKTEDMIRTVEGLGRPILSKAYKDGLEKAKMERSEALSKGVVRQVTDTASRVGNLDEQLGQRLTADRRSEEKQRIFDTREAFAERVRSYTRTRRTEERYQTIYERARSVNPMEYCRTHKPSTIRQVIGSVLLYGTEKEKTLWNTAREETRSLGRERGRSYRERHKKGVYQGEIDCLSNLDLERLTDRQKDVYFVVDAMRVIGVRPCELSRGNVTFDREKQLVKVQTAKRTNGRGISRMIGLREYSDKDRESVQRGIEAAKRVDLSNLSRDFKRIQAKLFPQRAKDRMAKPYDMRHQFAADLKRTETKEVVSRALGHISERTAQEYYGRKQGGHERPKTFVK